MCPSLPESSLPSSVSVSVASKSKWHIKNTPTSAQYFILHNVQSGGRKCWSVCSIGMIWLTCHPSNQDITTDCYWFRKTYIKSRLQPTDKLMMCKHPCRAFTCTSELHAYLHFYVYTAFNWISTHSSMHMCVCAHAHACAMHIACVHHMCVCTEVCVCISCRKIGQSV